MKNNFKKIANTYKEFLEGRKMAQKTFDDAMGIYNQNKGYYGKKYIDEQNSKLQKELSAQTVKARNKLQKDVEAMKKQIYADNMPSVHKIDKELQELLNSGLRLSVGEIQSLAQKHKDESVNMRLLNQYANDNGYTINGYIGVEEQIEKLEEYAKRVDYDIRNIDSPYVFVTPLEHAEREAETYFKRTQSFDELEVVETPKTIEDEIALDIHNRHKSDDKIALTEDGEDAFLKGFLGGSNDMQGVNGGNSTNEEEEKAIDEDIQDLDVQDDKTSSQGSIHSYLNPATQDLKQVEIQESEEKEITFGAVWAEAMMSKGSKEE